MEEELKLYIASKVSDLNDDEYEIDELNANNNSLYENGEQRDGNITSIIKSITSEWINKVEIKNGKLIFVGEDLQQRHWAYELLNTAYIDKVETIGNEISLKNSIASKLLDYKIYGNSIQNGTPTSDNPVEIKSVGNRTTNLVDMFNPILTKGSRVTKLSSKTVQIYTPTINQDAIFRFTPTANTTYAIRLDGVRIVSGRSDVIGNIRLQQNGKTVFLWQNGSKYGERKIFGLGIHTFTPSTTDEISILIRLSGGYGATTVNITGLVVTKETDMPGVFEAFGDYKIPITVNSETKNIYLHEPLRKVGDYVDYIDFANQKVVRNVEVLDDTGNLLLNQSLKGLSTPIEESIELPELSVNEGTNTITVNSEIAPSKVEVTYNSK